MSKILSQHSTYSKSLYWRYLLWAYKTTRESFERIERKTTQLVVDESIHKHLQLGCKVLSAKQMERYDQLLAEFVEYMAVKKADETKQKYLDGARRELNPDYVFLKARLHAIEATIVKMFGRRELVKIEKLFNDEFTSRILNAREHH